MEEDTVELATGPSAEAEHRKQKDMAPTAAETMLPPPRESHGGYAGSRFNAVRHGVL